MLCVGGRFTQTPTVPTYLPTYLPTYVCVAVLVGTGLWVTSVISNALRLCQCATNSNAGSVSLGGLECVAVFVSCPCRNEKHDIPLLVETCVHEVERRGESRPLHVRIITLSPSEQCMCLPCTLL